MLRWPLIAIYALWAMRETVWASHYPTVGNIAGAGLSWAAVGILYAFTCRKDKQR